MHSSGEEVTQNLELGLQWVLKSAMTDDGLNLSSYHRSKVITHTEVQSNVPKDSGGYKIPCQ